MKNILYGVLAVSLLLGTPTLLLAQGQADFTEVGVIDRKPIRDFSVRLEEARENFEEKITEAKERRIVVACRVAQPKIGAVVERTQNFQARHGEIHQKWLTKLTDLSARIVVAGIDTITLDDYIHQLNALVAQSNSDLESYVVGLRSVSTMDCEADAAAFYSALQTARATRALVIDSTKEVLSYIRTNIKTELQNIKQQIQDRKQAADDVQGELRNQTDGGA